MTINLQRPDLEALRGTKVTLVGHANRPIKKAAVEFPGNKDPIVGEVDAKNPTQVTFNLPPMMQDGNYRIVFSPKTDEKEGEPEVFKVRVLADEKPEVRITKPGPVIELPANSTLAVEGETTDDIGIAKMRLHMKVIVPNDPNDRPLVPQEYRNGMSFRRDSDGSYPTKIEYKDFVDLTKVKADDKDRAAFHLEEGMEIEYWLEAIDNCDVPPGPNSGFSGRNRVKITPPVTAEQQKKQNEDKQKLQQEQKQHEQKQDQNNAKEERKRPQPKPPQGDQPKQQQPQAGDKDPGQKKDAANPMQKGMGDETQPKSDEPQPMDDPKFNEQKNQVEQALNKDDPKNDMNPDMPPNPPKNGMNSDTPPMPQPKGMNPDTPPMPQPKGMNPDTPPMPQPKGMNPDTPPMPQPKGMNPDMPPMPQPKGMNPDMPPMPQPNSSGGNTGAQSNQGSSSTPQDLNNLAEKLDSDDPKEREQAREQVRKMMEQNEKNPPNPVDQQKQMQEQRDKLPDQLEKEKFDQSNKRIQQEMEKLNRERKERKKRVEDAADKAQSDDEKTREEGRKDIEKELQNPRTRDDVDKQLQNLANGANDKTREKRIDEARDLSRKNIEKMEQSGSQQPMPKKDDNQEELVKKKKDNPKTNQANQQPPPTNPQDVNDLADKLRGNATRKRTSPRATPADDGGIEEESAESRGAGKEVQGLPRQAGRRIGKTEIR